MIEFLYSIDKSVFLFFNRTVANPVTDLVMPAITGISQTPAGITVLVLFWLLLIWKGGRTGLIVGLLLIPLVAMSDQLSSAVIKKIVERPRPCHELNGTRVVENVRLLVSCGGGFSFPSSHATNWFAIATFVSHRFRRLAPALFTFAVVMGLSRIFVGVHYPSDILGGAAVGTGCAFVLIGLWRFVERRLGTPPDTPAA